MMFIIGTGRMHVAAAASSGTSGSRHPSAAARATASDTAEHGIGAEPALVVGAVQVDQRLVQRLLVSGVQADHG